MQIQGHTLDEQDELSEDFQTMVVAALHRVVDELALKIARETTGRTGLVAAGPADDVIALWDDEVPELVAYLDGVYEAGALEAAAEMAVGLPVPDGYGIPGVPNSFALEYLQQASNRLKGVGDELWENIRDEITIGLSQGESTNEIAGRIQAAAGFTEARAKTVARTELVGASNAGTHMQVLMIVPEAKKEWVATTDGRTRMTHRHADGQKVPVDQSFSVGGSMLRWPGDPGGAAGEVVNCRCTLIFDVDEDTEPALTCDPNDLTPALAALVSMPGSSCTCAVTLPSGGATGLPTNLTQAQHDEIYSAFMNPDPISPAYGGAKIYKKLVAAKAKLAADAPELAGLSEHQILAVVDEIYKGKKFTFTEKFDEWLPTAAGKKAAPNVSIPSPSTSPVTPPPISTTIPTPATVMPKLPPIKNLPKPSELTYTGKTLGSHGAQVWIDDNGGKWLFKPQADFMTEIDTATAKLKSKSLATRTGTYEITLKGKKGSIQYMFDGSADAWPSGHMDPTKLSEADKLTLQREHVFDWLVGNHDAHEGQFVRLPSGELVGVDKGQAFKFLGSDKLHWTYQAPGNVGTPVYNTLWKAYVDGKIDLTDPTTGEVGAYIDKLMSMSDAEYRALFKSYAEGLPKLPHGFTSVDQFLDAMVERKNNLKSDFATLWAKAQKEKLGHVTPSTPSVPTPVTSVIPSPPTPGGGTPLSINDVFAEMLDPTLKDGDVVAYGVHPDGSKWRLIKRTGLNGVPYMDLERWSDLYGKYHNTHITIKNVNGFTDSEKQIQWTDSPDVTPPAAPTPPPAVPPPPPPPPPPPTITVTPPVTPTALTPKQKNMLLLLMKDPQPVTPGWGGAKVYKQLQEVKKKASGNPAYAGLTDREILQLIDSVAVHKTSKTYESVVVDWLNTPAGNKYAGGGPDILDKPVPGATVTAPSTPSPIPMPVSTSTSLPSPNILNSSTYSDLQIFADTGSPIELSDVIAAAQHANDGDVLAVTKDPYDVYVLRVVGGKLHFSTAEPLLGFKYDIEVKDEDHLKKLFSLYGYGKWKVPPGTKLPDAFTPSVSPAKAGKKAAKKAAKKVASPSSPPVDAADAILTDSGDITKYSATDHNFVLAKFKTGSGSYLTDTPAQIFDHLQQTLAALKTNPKYQDLTMMQLIRMIDEAGAKKVGVANKKLFEQKISSYLKTSAGKTHAATPVKAVKKAAKKAAKKTTSSTTSVVPSGTKLDTPELASQVQAANPVSSRKYENIYGAEVRELHNEMMAQQGDWTAAQKSSLRTYTGSSYHAINGCLRGTGPCTEQIVKHIKNAQAGMRRSTRNIVVRRGTNADEFPGFTRSATFDQLQTLKGRELKADSFLSTSFGDRAAFGGNVLIEFDIPAGTPLAYVKDISQFSSENEILLAAGLKYVVESVTKLDSYKTLVKVRVIVP